MLNFTKMHALGNDFMIINLLSEAISIQKLPIATLANRNRGVGFDQLLIIDKSKQADYFCHIFNADGSKALQCGNGLRCVARWLHEQKIIKTNDVTLQTEAGIYPIHIKDYDHITVSLGEPEIHQQNSLWLFPDNQNYQVSIISFGNLHAIVNMQDIDHQPLETIATFIQAQQNNCNVGLMEIMNTKQIKLRTYERGVGETLACGSNAAAAALVGILNFGLENKIKVHLLHGQLDITWQQKEKLMTLTGPATLSYQGIIDLQHFPQ